MKLQIGAKSAPFIECKESISSKISRRKRRPLPAARPNEGGTEMAYKMAVIKYSQGTIVTLPPQVWRNLSATSSAKPRLT